ncbi:MAG TPA: hypothetical protein DD417_10040 [Elusimicrobia bacterium]|nr:hypothetical protein [Elusimicrobiota bacterium]
MLFQVEEAEVEAVGLPARAVFKAPVLLGAHVEPAPPPEGAGDLVDRIGLAVGVLVQGEFGVGRDKGLEIGAADRAGLLRRVLLGSLAAGMLCAATARPCFGETRDWKFSNSINYETGDFGTGTRSEILYVPFTLKRSWGAWDGSATVSLLQLRSSALVTNVGGSPVKVGRGRGSPVTTSYSGVGDTVLRGGYALVREGPGPFDLSLVAKLKIPTADESEGLGTGEFDEGVGVEFGKEVVPSWLTIVDLYYTLIGSPAGTDLDNQSAAAFGVAHTLGKGWTATALCELSNPLVAGETAPAALRGILDYKLDEQAHVFAGVLQGLSDGSPDVGLSLGGSYRF